MKNEFSIIMKNGKPFVKHEFCGTVYEMKVYDVNGNPYIRRFGEKWLLANEGNLLDELREVC